MLLIHSVNWSAGSTNLALPKSAQNARTASTFCAGAANNYIQNLGHGFFRTRSAGRLHRETDHRLRKRQTGNEPAYSQFLEWHMQWLFDASRSNPDQLESFVNLLLAFPPGEFFEDRVFEIWCLHQVIELFRRCGAVILEGPRPLSLRSEHAICEMTYENYQFQVWFQKALPIASARWEYLHSRKPLTGIPDITVIGEDGRRLLIDAKRRVVRTQTRSEETYKMLGYLENYRELFVSGKFWAALCFLSDDDLFTEIITEEGHKMVLVGAHTDNPQICAFGGRMDTFTSEWLYQQTNPGFGTSKGSDMLM